MFTPCHTDPSSGFSRGVALREKADATTTSRLDLLDAPPADSPPCPGCGLTVADWLQRGGGSGVKPPADPVRAAKNKGAWAQHKCACQKAATAKAAAA